MAKLLTYSLKFNVTNTKLYKLYIIYKTLSYISTSIGSWYILLKYYENIYRKHPYTINILKPIFKLVRNLLVSVSNVRKIKAQKPIWVIKLANITREHIYCLVQESIWTESKYYKIIWFSISPFKICLPLQGLILNSIFMPSCKPIFFQLIFKQSKLNHWIQLLIN